MGVDEIGLLGPQQRHEGGETLRSWAKSEALPFQRQGQDAEALCPQRVEQRPIGAGADHLVPARTPLPQQRGEEVPHGKIGIGQLEDFHGMR